MFEVAWRRSSDRPRPLRMLGRNRIVQWLVSRDHGNSRAVARRLLSLLDLTSLGESDTPEQIEALCSSVRATCETRRALGAGADEIDLVLADRCLLDGDVECVRTVIRSCRAICADGVVLKLILETGVLATLEQPMAVATSSRPVVSACWRMQRCICNWPGNVWVRAGATRRISASVPAHCSASCA